VVAEGDHCTPTLRPQVSQRIVAIQVRITGPLSVNQIGCTKIEFIFLIVGSHLQADVNAEIFGGNERWK
jgi:hypothetical protein